MQIAMFCRRDDEAAYYEKFGKQYGVTLKLLDEIPTPQTASLAEGCLCASIITTPVPPQTLDALWEAGVRYLSTRTIGYDHIDLAYAKKIGMHVGNVSYSPDSVADYALMLILMAVRRCKSILRHAAVQNYTLPGMQGRELPRLTVGVAGTGRIGRAVIARLAGFGCRILAYDLHESEDVRPFAQYVPFDTLLSESDVLTLHMPATRENTHLFNAEAFAKMKQDAILVNTARGALVDSKALLEALESGKLVVRGEGLTVSKLDTDTGNLTVTAQNISSLVYGDKNKADVDKYGRQAMEKSIVDAISVTDVGPKATKAQP